MNANCYSAKLVLGTVQFGLSYGIANTSGKPSFDLVKDIIQLAYDSGIRLLDTAAAYGESEIVLGKALKELNLLDKMQIVSKIAPVPESSDDNTVKAHIRNSLEKSLANLGVPKLHAVLFQREADVKYLPYLKELAQSGMAGAAGVSLDSYVPDEAAQAGAVQVPGNVFDRRFLKFIKEAHARGTQIFDRSVYLQGLLLMPEDKIPQPLQPVVKYRRLLEKLAADNGMPLSELCMRYLLSIPEIDGVLTGVDNTAQLQDNVNLAEKGPLSENILQEIFNIIPELPVEWIRPTCWKTVLGIK